MDGITSDGERKKYKNKVFCMDRMRPPGFGCITKRIIINFELIFI